MENFMQWLGWFVVLGCVLPLVVLAILGVIGFWIGRQALEGFVQPDATELHKDLAKIRAKHPNLKRDELVQKVIKQQSLKCGLVGAITGVGGFFTLPISLPIDILVTARLQSTMVGFIAELYGYSDSLENKAATYAVMTGGNEISALSTKLIQNYLPRFFGKSFSKLIPFFGAFISFALNYFFAQSTARLAIKWYSSKSKAEILKTGEMAALS